MIRNRPEFHRARSRRAVLRRHAGVDLQLLGARPDRVPGQRLRCEGRDRRGRAASSNASSRCATALPTIEHIVRDRALRRHRRRHRPVLATCGLRTRRPRRRGRDVDAADDLATIIYTSGTTGPPKGVMLSHSNVVWTLESVGQSMRDQTDIDDFAGKRHVSYLPMAHVMERLLGHYYMVDFATQITCCPETSQMRGHGPRGPPELVHRRAPRVGEAVRRRQRRDRRPTREGQERSTTVVAARCRSSEKMTRGTATHGGDRHLELPRRGGVQGRSGR